MPEPANAALTFCNDTADTRNVAVAYNDQQQLISRGWWVVKPGQCKVLIGGELTQRYYYYHASAPGVRPPGGDAIFCASLKAFKIVGGEKCRELGYRRLAFRKLDTGTIGESFTLTLAPEEHGAPSAGANATSEPATVTGVFQGCTQPQSGKNFCALKSGEWTYILSQGAETPAWVFAALRDSQPGRELTIEGDIVGQRDARIDLVVRALAQHASRDAADSLHARLLGEWTNAGDPRSTIQFSNGQYLSYYRGALLKRGHYDLDRTCDGRKADLVVRIDGDNVPYCYDLDWVGGGRLDLIYLAQGRRLSYARAGQ